jgi:thymidylate kinase
MFIVFCGVDKSGKTSLSKAFCEWLNKNSLKGGNWKWTKEPTFSSEFADKINSAIKHDEFARERYFLADRLKHQKELQGNIVCDRYIWSGLAYANIFSPRCFEFVKELYLNSDLFLQPDYNIFVNTPVEVCVKRDPKLVKDTLDELHNSFYEMLPLIRSKSKIIYINASGSLENSLKLLVEEFYKYEESRDYE